MADIFDSAYVPDRAKRTDPLVSPANKADTADLTGIAPALVITAELDLLQEEGARYAERLAEVEPWSSTTSSPGRTTGTTAPTTRRHCRPTP